MILFQVVHTEHVFSVYEFSVIEIGFSVMLKCFLLYLTLYFLFWIIVTAYVEVISMQLWSIYAAGNTVPIPFLRATDISPIALLSDNVLGGIQCDNSGTVAAEALQELFSGDGPSKKGRRIQNEVITPNPSPSLPIKDIFVLMCLFYMLQMPLPPGVYQRLTSSSTLLNLAQALAYHKM
jgi:hypothetical protein